MSYSDVGVGYTDSDEDSEQYQRGYAEACEVTDRMLGDALETCESFRKLNRRYYEEIKRLRGLLGLDPYPLFDVEKVVEVTS